MVLLASSGSGPEMLLNILQCSQDKPHMSCWLFRGSENIAWIVHSNISLAWTKGLCSLLGHHSKMYCPRPCKARDLAGDNDLSQDNDTTMEKGRDKNSLPEDKTSKQVLRNEEELARWQGMGQGRSVPRRRNRRKSLRHLQRRGIEGLMQETGNELHQQGSLDPCAKEWA